MNSGLCGCGCGQRTNKSPVNNRALKVRKGEPYAFLTGHSSRVRVLKRLSMEERFWRFVRPPDDPDACWIWGGSLARRYGTIGNLKGRSTLSANRASWEIANGPIPPGMHVLHNCPSGDNSGCVNPRHLWLGTHEENMADMVTKKRYAKGECASNTKLTAHDVIEIRRLRALGWKMKTLQDKFWIDNSQVSRICSGQSWQHITNGEKVMPKGPRHRDAQVPYCPGCFARSVRATGGPIKRFKGMDKAPVECGKCGREWYSENRNVPGINLPLQMQA